MPLPNKRVKEIALNGSIAVQNTLVAVMKPRFRIRAVRADDTHTVQVEQPYRV